MWVMSALKVWKRAVSRKPLECGLLEGGDVSKKLWLVSIFEMSRWNLKYLHWEDMWGPSRGKQQIRMS